MIKVVGGKTIVGMGGFIVNHKNEEDCATQNKTRQLSSQFKNIHAIVNARNHHLHVVRPHDLLPCINLELQHEVRR